MRFVLLMMSLTVLFAEASSRGLHIVTRDGQTVGGYDKSYALVIGVSDYRNGWPDLNSVPGELDSLSKALDDKGFQVVRVNDPTEDQLKDALEEFVDEYGYAPRNRLLFFFSGHGYTRDNNTKGYLVPVDAPDPRVDERGFVRKAYAMTELMSLARRIEANHALFLFDSCFSGTVFKTKALPEIPPLIGELTSKPVRQFITAGDAGEEVPARSVFTPAFIDAIRYGTGDLNGDGFVTGTELGMHLQSVVRTGGAQTPQYGKIQDYNLARGDYVFLAALTRPAPLDQSVDVGFSIDDLTQQANSQKAARRAWDSKLQGMRDAFQMVKGLDSDPETGVDLKISAWNRFLVAFNEDNPFSRADNDLRTQASVRVEQLQRGAEATGFGLVVRTSPADATILVDGKRHDPSQQLQPGTYQVTVSAEGFVTQSSPVTIVDRIKDVTFRLEPDTTAYFSDYRGVISRKNVNGGGLQSRLYEVDFTSSSDAVVRVYNGPDASSGVRNTLQLTGSLTGDRTFSGQARVPGGSTSWTPDDVTIRFFPGTDSIEWDHSDGNISGNGTLTRSSRVQRISILPTSYAGVVSRYNSAGETLPSRYYSVTSIDDSSYNVTVYSGPSASSGLRATLRLVGAYNAGRTVFEGTATPADAGADWTPDRVTMRFDRGAGTVSWEHTDGRYSGRGTLSQ